MQRNNFGGIEIGSPEAGGKTVASQIDRDRARLLNHLIHLGRDLAAAAGVAMRRLQDDELRGMIKEHSQAHFAVIGELADCVRELGQDPARHGDLRSVIERGRVLLGKGDHGILEAMATNEEVLRAAYREALAQPFLPEAVMAVLHRALDQENAHVSVYDRALGRFVG